MASGKVAMVLEGGYDLASICDSAEECIKALLGDASPPISQGILLAKPNANCVESLEEVIKIQCKLHAKFYLWQKNIAAEVPW